jgi:hypothetical protein
MTGRRTRRVHLRPINARALENRANPTNPRADDTTARERVQSSTAAMTALVVRAMHYRMTAGAAEF